MKKKLCLFLICLGFACSAISQTYSYRYSHSVNEDGVRKIHPQWKMNPVVYMTFVKEKSICYQSNEKGEILQYASPYKYIGKENDMYVYQDTGSNFLLVSNKQRLRMFTTDFIQYGYWTLEVDGSWFYVFKYEPNPNKKEAPKNLF